MALREAAATNIFLNDVWTRLQATVQELVQTMGDGKGILGGVLAGSTRAQCCKVTSLAFMLSGTVREGLKHLVS